VTKYIPESLKIAIGSLPGICSILTSVSWRRIGYDDFDAKSKQHLPVASDCGNLLQTVPFYAGIRMALEMNALKSHRSYSLADADYNIHYDFPFPTNNYGLISKVHCNQKLLTYYHSH
jgi:hypothetical protein